MNKYLHIGPPVYFVVKEGFNFSDPQKQKLICSGSGCDEYSLGGQLSIASRMSNMYVILKNLECYSLNVVHLIMCVFLCSALVLLSLALFG